MPQVHVAITVVIVNYRTPDLTVACLKSLEPEIARIPGSRAIVVDNASDDGSGTIIPEAIRRHGFDRWCGFHQLPVNGGFGYGNNEAIRRSRDGAGRNPDLIWFLNPDTVVLPGALRELVNFMLERPHVAIAGGRIENEDGSLQHSAFRFISPLGELENALANRFATRLLSRYVVAPDAPDSPTRVDWVSGANMMIRGSVFEKLEGFDEEYFLYFEETDLCLRAARGGHESWYVPDSRIVHLMGQSTGVTGGRKSSKRRPEYWFRSRRRYYAKNLGQMALHTANLLWLIAYPIGRLSALLRGRQRTDPPLLWWDFLRYNYGRSDG